ncbi:hypothetical protein [Ruegeria lacuscaerulensis]|uniref:hypothetical protein n=1 Tax=Ruegeria lacuscaerulensis TaxID=55218 RepID=UPI001F2E72F7|nr:hypothetical protein [Ruegeria lacuscaerulensis]
MIDMIVRQVMRRLVNKGVDKGFDMASRMGGKSDQGVDTGQRKKTSGPRPSQNMRQAQKMTRQMRRFMKF